MPEEKTGTAADAFEAFRKLRDSYLEGMSKVMIETVNKEEYAQATGALLNNYVTVLAPFREAMDKAMAMTLEQFSLPSRQQVMSLAERFTNLEIRLDDMDAKLDHLVELLSAGTPISNSPENGKRAREATPMRHTTGKRQ